MSYYVIWKTLWVSTADGYTERTGQISRDVIEGKLRSFLLDTSVLVETDLTEICFMETYSSSTDH